jgi:RNA exonuclease 1
MSDQDIYQLLTSYLLPADQLRLLGYPMDSTLFPGKAYIYRDPEISSLLHETADYDDGDIVDQGAATSLDATAPAFFPAQEYQFMLNAQETSGPVLNATAKEFVPSNTESSDSEKKPLKGVHSSPNLENTEDWVPSLVSVPSSPNLLLDPSIHISSSTSSETNPSSISSKLTSDEDDAVLDERRCVRCTKTFFMHTGGEYYTEESCTYHWGKLRSQNKNNPSYQCCGGRAGRASSRGCSVAQVHVWSGFPLSRGIVGPLDGYVKTRYRKSLQKERNFGVFGVDCEMCYTRFGLELTKVTIVGVDGRLVYESLVSPENSIVDHNTRFSGISERDLNTGPTKSLKEVQNDLNGFINADSILIGHGLENDLRALCLLHLNIIDTSLVFPHFYGLPYRRSLRTLVSSYLKRDIQGNAWGHDSYEDARACVELMLWKVRKDMEKERKLEIPGRKI